jgi:hypothetical protein
MPSLPGFLAKTLYSLHFSLMHAIGLSIPFSSTPDDDDYDDKVKSISHYTIACTLLSFLPC